MGSLSRTRARQPRRPATVRGGGRGGRALGQAGGALGQPADGVEGDRSVLLAIGRVDDEGADLMAAAA